MAAPNSDAVEKLRLGAVTRAAVCCTVGTPRAPMVVRWRPAAGSHRGRRMHGIVSEIRRLAGEGFPVRAERIEILDSPADFYERLLVSDGCVWPGFEAYRCPAIGSVQSISNIAVVAVPRDGFIGKKPGTTNMDNPGPPVGQVTLGCSPQ